MLPFSNSDLDLDELSLESITIDDNLNSTSDESVMISASDNDTSLLFKSAFLSSAIGHMPNKSCCCPINLPNVRTYCPSDLLENCSHLPSALNDNFP